MGATWGRVPDDAELTAILEALSQKLYNGAWTVSLHAFNEYRDHSISAARRILHDRHLPATAEAWAALAAQLTGRPVRPLAEARRQSANHRWRRHQDDIDAPTIARLGPSGWRLAHDAAEGLAVIERKRIIRQWDGEQYVPIGTQLVYEVR